ncbi:chromate efflux transporter [Cognatiyoonia sp. IB215446]|uniref:chromate efflux transporter n=1 Tax=Cognatiyoonia sp. IB215446 TaxID=3097355 RepID=UPI002A0F05C4|nr:chromate efflux transporter [Cognatiyoonia sp. IB215446]MDX8348862.1 chromate efflux transporter [Cognatiyoonia sp. IB215446]
MHAELIRVFGRIGLMSFGGPAAQIALMHKELVEKRDWLTEEQYLRALSFCMLLPGPEAMQLATYAGWKKGGIWGGLIGGGLFVLPGAIVIAALALAYGAYGNLPVAQALFLGVKATVVFIVIEALLKISKRALKTSAHIALAVGAFIALFFFALPFPLVILVGALIGASMQSGDASASSGPGVSLRGTLLTLAIGVAIWAAPFLFIATSGSTFLRDIGLFFSLLAVVTFGGAYAVLAYMTQEVVVSYQWLTTPQMMDALGLAETTPGPLILVTQFVGMIAGMAQGGVGLALIAGALTLWVTFIPCFIWIFAGAPLIDWLDGKPRLRGALAGITAAVVGVIANLSLWFAAHVFFGEVRTIDTGIFQTIWPALSSIQPLAVLLAIISGILLLWRHWPLPLVLIISAALSLLISSALTLN